MQKVSQASLWQKKIVALQRNKLSLKTKQVLFTFLINNNYSTYNNLLPKKKALWVSTQKTQFMKSKKKQNINSEH